VITSPEALFRRSLTERVGGQRELGHTHDLEMWLRLAAHSDVAYIEGVDQAWHREHSASLSQRAQDPLVILPEIRRAFDTLFSGDGARIDSAERLNRLAHTALAADAVDRAVRVLKSGSPRSEAGELLDFASDCLPDARSWSDYVWADERVADRPRSRFDRARLWLLPRRVKGWFRNRARARRWRRTGVYERLEIGSPR
jgi:hypothetical protein